MSGRVGSGVGGSRFFGGSGLGAEGVSSGSGGAAAAAAAAGAAAGVEGVREQKLILVESYDDFVKTVLNFNHEKEAGEPVEVVVELDRVSEADKGLIREALANRVCFDGDRSDIKLEEDADLGQLDFGYEEVLRWTVESVDDFCDMMASGDIVGSGLHSQIEVELICGVSPGELQKLEEVGVGGIRLSEAGQVRLYGWDRAELGVWDVEAFDPFAGLKVTEFEVADAEGLRRLFYLTSPEGHELVDVKLQFGLDRATQRWVRRFIQGRMKTDWLKGLVVRVYAQERYWMGTLDLRDYLTRLQSLG